MISHRVAVRPHLAWYWRSLFLGAVLCFGVVLAWWVFANGGLFSGGNRGGSEREFEQLGVRLRQLETENAQMRVSRATLDRYSQIDAEAQKSLERELKSLQAENAALKEELAFIRGMASPDRSGALNIQRFTVRRSIPGTYRFQLLLVQAGQKEKTFRGRFQIVVTVLGEDGKSVRLLPSGVAAGENYKISLKSYQSIDGEFQVAPGQVVKSVEARIFSDGSTQPKLSKIVNLS